MYNHFPPPTQKARRAKDLQIRGQMRDYRIAEAQRKSKQLQELKAARVYGEYVRRTRDFEALAAAERMRLQ